MADDITWLDDLGSGSRSQAETGNRAIKMNHTWAVLVELAGFLIDTAEKNMEKSASVATGKIKSSMDAGPIETRGTKTSVAVMIDKNYKWTDKGVRGTEGGKSFAGLAFKTKYANKKMATAILKWLRSRGNAGRIKYKAVSRNEAKSQRINRTVKKADNLKGLAYAVSVNIKKKGIKPTLFFTNAVKETEKIAGAKLAAGIKLDIIESLKNL